MIIRSNLDRNLVKLSILSLALFIFACTPRNGGVQGSQMTSSNDNMDMASSATMDGVEETATGSNKPLMDIANVEGPTVLMDVAESGLGLEMYRGAGYATLVVSTASGTLTPDSFRLTNPERLVLDINNPLSLTSKNFDLSDTGLISSVRVGSHPGKTRIVIDIAKANLIDRQATNDKGGVLVTLAETEQQAQTGEATLTAMTSSNQVAATEEFNSTRNSEGAETWDALEEKLAARTNVSDNTSTNAIDATEQAVSETSASMTTELEQEVVVNADTAALPEGPTEITSVSIEKGPAGESRVVAELDAPVIYTLEKTAPSEYVLRLEGAEASQAVPPSVLSADAATSIRSVRTIKDGNDLLLRIFSKPNTKLRANNTSDSIVITEESGSDLMAQLSPEAVAEGGEGNSDSTASSGGDENAESSDLGELSALLEDEPKYTGRLISLDLQDTDIDNALRIIAEVSDLNIIASDDVTGKVTLRLIDVPWDQALDVILKTNNLDKVREGNVIRIAPVNKLREERELLKQAQQAEEDLEPLKVKYVRVSYAKVSELKPLVESVLSERGTVTYDERSNQVILRDISKGLKDAVKLISKLDLRTPQVLLETQIIEANRTLLRDLGVELGFQLVQSPETGNALGYNFPNSVSIGGSADPTGSGNPAAISFPANITADSGGAALTALLGSADGSMSLQARLSSLENEGRVRIVSRPSVATTNNRQALIKSVTKIRVRRPDGGLSVATGQGSSAGSGGGAFEEFEVGIILEVTPQASPDYYVLLDVFAKSSTLGPRNQSVTDIPPEIERSATSTILVSSGQTFALGGIYKITDQDAVSGVPFLKDIPFLGHLFRRSTIDNSDEELIFFITPRIVEGSFDDAAMKVGS